MTSPAATESRLSFREKFAYGLGDTASNFVWQGCLYFLPIFYTDVFGLSLGVVATLMWVTRILDAVVDPFCGALGDRTSTRWGKFRPYLLWMALPYGIMGCALFATPHLGPHGRLIYAFVTYPLMMVIYSLINIPYGAMSGVITSSPQERTLLNSYRFVCAFGGGFLIGWLMLPLKHWLGGGNEARGYQNAMAVFAVASVSLFLFTFRCTRERVAPPPGQNSSVRQDLRDLLGNGPWIVLILLAVFTLANVGIRSGTALYYFKYYVGDTADRWSPWFVATNALAMMAGAWATPRFTRRFSKKSLMIWLSALNAAFLAAFYFVPPDRIALMLALNIVGTFFAGPTPALVWSMYGDAADYGEWKFGRRATGLVISAATFAQKFGLAVGVGVFPLLLARAGYVPNAAQSPGALEAIKLVFAIFPGVLGLCCAITMMFYPLDDAQVLRIEADLAGRKSLQPVPA